MRGSPPTGRRSPGRSRLPPPWRAGTRRGRASPVSGPASGRPTSSAPTGSPAGGCRAGRAERRRAWRRAPPAGFFDGAAFGSTPAPSRRGPGRATAWQGAARLTAVRVVVAVVVTVAVRTAELLRVRGGGVATLRRRRREATPSVVGGAADDRRIRRRNRRRLRGSSVDVRVATGRASASPVVPRDGRAGRRVVGHGERRAACRTGVTGDDERSQGDSRDERGAPLRVPLSHFVPPWSPLRTTVDRSATSCQTMRGCGRRAEAAAAPSRAHLLCFLRIPPWIARLIAPPYCSLHEPWPPTWSASEPWPDCVWSRYCRVSFRLSARASAPTSLDCSTEPPPPWLPTRIGAFSLEAPSWTATASASAF